jgi:uncharacterized membrane protein YhaH (DUF805 family)
MPISMRSKFERSLCNEAPFLLESEQAAVLMLALTSQSIWLLSLWPILAVGSKRLHDRNKNGWWLLVFWLLPFALFCGGFSIYFFDDPKTGRSGDFSTGSILIFASLPPALWGIVELGILPGTKGPNLYGAEPAGHSGSDKPSTRGFMA